MKRQKVNIERHKDSLFTGAKRQLLGIWKLATPGFLSGQHIDAVTSECSACGSGNMLIHIETDQLSHATSFRGIRLGFWKERPTSPSSTTRLYEARPRFRVGCRSSKPAPRKRRLT